MVQEADETLCKLTWLQQFQVVRFRSFLFVTVLVKPLISFSIYFSWTNFLKSTTTMPLVSSFHFGQYHQRLTVLIISHFYKHDCGGAEPKLNPSDRTEERSRSTTQRFYVHLFGPFLTSIVKIRIIHGWASVDGTYTAMTYLPERNLFFMYVMTKFRKDVLG